MTVRYANTTYMLMKLTPQTTRTESQSYKQLILKTFMNVNPSRWQNTAVKFLLSVMQDDWRVNTCCWKVSDNCKMSFISKWDSYTEMHCVQAGATPYIVLPVGAWLGFHARHFYMLNTHQFLMYRTTYCCTLSGWQVASANHQAITRINYK